MLKAIQAKHLDDASILEAIPQIMRERDLMNLGASRWDIARRCYPDAPERVVLAKLKSMVRRGIIKGCPCGCRGDFHLPGDSAD